MAKTDRLDFSLNEIITSEEKYVKKLNDFITFLDANNRGDSSESILVNKLRNMTQPTKAVYNYHLDNGESHH